MKYPPLPASTDTTRAELSAELSAALIAEVAAPATVVATVVDAITLAQAQAMYASLVASDPMLDAFGAAPWEDLGGSWRRAIPGFTFTASAVGYQVRVDG